MIWHKYPTCICYLPWWISLEFGIIVQRTRRTNVRVGPLEARRALHQHRAHRHAHPATPAPASTAPRTPLLARSTCTTHSRLLSARHSSIQLNTAYATRRPSITTPDCNAFEYGISIRHSYRSMLSLDIDPQWSVSSRLFMTK